jgi:flagellar basal-body rod protein FlgB
VLFDTTQLALQRAMEGAGLRQQVLSSNLANVNTPGYQRKDLDFHGALASAMGAADPAAALAATPLTPVTDASAATRADGNSVDVDAESAKLSANGLEYEQLSGAMRVELDILRTAMGVS